MTQGRRHQWTPEQDALLGTMADDVVAAIVGVIRECVRDRRTRLGVPAYPRTSRLNDLTGRTIGAWTVLRRVEDHVVPSGHRFTRWLCRCECGAEKKVFGSRLAMPDNEPLGCSACAARTVGERKRTQWTPEMIARLGQASDGNVATELGLYHATVAAKRRELGLPAYRKPLPDAGELTEGGRQALALRAEGKTLEEIGHILGVSKERARQLLLPRKPRKERAKRSSQWPGRPRRTGKPTGRPPGGKNHRWTPEEDALFETLTIEQVAERLGVSCSSAANRWRILAKRNQSAPRPADQ